MLDVALAAWRRSSGARNFVIEGVMNFTPKIVTDRLAGSHVRHATHRRLPHAPNPHYGGFGVARAVAASAARSAQPRQPSDGAFS